MPDLGDESSWLIIETSDGRFYGTGGSWKWSEEWTGYGSPSEDDVSLDAALAAAHQWAARYDVLTIWVHAAMASCGPQAIPAYHAMAAWPAPAATNRRAPLPTGRRLPPE